MAVGSHAHVWAAPAIRRDGRAGAADVAEALGPLGKVELQGAVAVDDMSLGHLDARGVLRTALLGGEGATRGEAAAVVDVDQARDVALERVALAGAL